MVTGEEKDGLMKSMEWKNIGDSASASIDSGTEATVVKKRLPKKLRQIPDFYFLPKKSLLSTMAFYGACIAGGIGAGMLTEIWINKKVKEDGGVIWEFDK